MTPPDITLRDYFAGLAMQTLILEKSGKTIGLSDSLATDHNYDFSVQLVAQASYAVADFMLQAREKPPGTW